MIDICIYLQVHQPRRLRSYSFLDIGHCTQYEDEQKNKEIIRRVARKCYLPTNNILRILFEKYPQFKVSFSLSGVVLDQFEQYCPEVLESFQQLVETGHVELLGETYYHSLAFLHSLEEFKEQIALHNQKIQQLFNVRPTVLRNTELIYNNDIAAVAHELGYQGMLLEGTEKILGWRAPNFVYQAAHCPIGLLLRNYRLSDDISFRFSNRDWKGFPLSADKYAYWVNQIHGNGTNVNIFMDYETFGEHQWEDTGIHSFLAHLPEKLLAHPDNRFGFPSEVLTAYEPVASLDVPHPVSWADIERDLSAWVGNDMQRAALSKLYELRSDIKRSGDPILLEKWRQLQTSDHFYYMCTKWFNDGDVHKYFSPYESPYDAFIYFMNVFNDLKQRCTQHNKGKKAKEKNLVSKIQ